MLFSYKARMTYYRLVRKARQLYDPDPKRLQQLVFDNAALRRTCDDLERHAQKAF